MRIMKLLMPLLLAMTVQLAVVCGSANAVVCPDLQSECPDGSTCCMLESGDYGCCPLRKAVCCSDHIHCCPNGYTCDVSGGTCSRGDTIATDWLSKISATAVLQSVNVICPDEKSVCPDNSTCCLLGSGSYGCCNLPKAVCCSDHVHCCPNGYQCDVTHERCIKSSLTTEWLEITLALSLITAPNGECPDHKSKCLDSQTCCQLASGGYQCCPLPKDVCCSDHIHCCPNGYQCDVSHQRCIKGSLTTEWLERTPALSLMTAPNGECPDHESSCLDSQTCCQLASGGYGCCQYPKAVCCSDHIHCCPEGYQCDVQHQRCTRGSLTTSWLEKTPATPLATAPNVKCPDRKSSCPSGQTCCQMVSGGYECCPLPKAVCCSDHIHCCPNGYQCDVSHQRCIKGSLTTEWLERTPALSLITAPNGECPDHESSCLDSQTCCQLASGGYGCCQYPKAVCCSDHIHCCPEGYQCDVQHQRCTRGSLTTSWLEKTPATPLATAPNVKCPDRKSSCPSGQTCCQMVSGGYECCPLPKAVCCSDRIHCCPNGYQCDVSHQRCIKGSLTTEWLERTPAVSLMTAPNGECPDQESSCPDGQTCCQLPSGKYGCCPLRQAVCCSDHIHCCPEGYQCDVQHQRCTRGSLTTSWLEKTPATALATAPNVKCPDRKSSCPSGQTCCQMVSGGYECCPLPKAVCCSDRIHCCPNGYQCDVSHQRCIKGSLTTEWLERTPAVSLMTAPNGECPDQESSCPDGQTCCQLPSGKYGCCPLRQAVCCSDHVHCCPHGYTCDVALHRCLKESKGLQLLFTPSTDMTEVLVQARVVCPGGKFYCPDTSTCCRAPGHEWGCCPGRAAVCCSDHIHCCPAGTTCDIAHHACRRRDELLPWRSESIKTLKPINKHIPFTPKSNRLNFVAAMNKDLEEEVKGVDIICPDHQSKCPDGNTCCRLRTGDWTCCPLPNATCCSDGLHCCPYGYRCDLTTMTCRMGYHVIPLSSP